MQRRHIHLPMNMGEKVADEVTGRLGSWRFIIIQSILLVFWIVLNSVGWFFHWDAAPFILLNLCLSFQAAFTGPIVLLSQNRQASRDKRRDDLEADEVQSLSDQSFLLMKINEQQLTMLNQQADMLDTLHSLVNELREIVQQKPGQPSQVPTKRSTKKL